MILQFLIKKNEKDLFNLFIKLGINSSSLSIENSVTSSRDVSFDNELSFRIGVEAEFILPFNKNKWGIIVEPTYHYYKSEKITEADNVAGGQLISNVNYKSIELPVGIRHYFFLKNRSKIFINASFILDFASNSTIELNRENGTTINSLEIESQNNLVFGLGYNQNEKFSLELRFQTPHEILNDYRSWKSEYKTVSIIFGYNIF